MCCCQLRGGGLAGWYFVDQERRTLANSFQLVVRVGGVPVSACMKKCFFLCVCNLSTYDFVL